MSTRIGLSPEGAGALQHVKDRRDVNTVIFRCTQTPRALVLEREGNLTHDELVQALPPDAARLVVYELAFATPEGSRKHETLLILWMPSNADAQEEAWTPAYETVKEVLPNVHVHLTARRPEHLEYRRLVALAG
ncbi:cofilin family protein [Streptomyces sp. NPDC059979]|uniref:cofilin family protein n=1 Tax=Streptomyces sp. NPDC059979 TaxID=3347021 RepID=UPI0036762482